MKAIGIRCWRAPPTPTPPWVLAARAARQSVGLDSIAAHPAAWTADYRAFARRALQSRLVARLGVTELHDEILAGWLAEEEAGEKTRLWASDLASQRLVDATVRARP